MPAIARLAALALSASLSAPPAFAGTADAYKAAYGSAGALAGQAAANKNQWPATTAALSEAKAAADAGDYDKALALARQAEALARASIHQSESEATAWKDGAIR